MLKSMTNTAPVASSAIQDFERRIGIQLPDDYRSFLEQYNGGCPEPEVFHMRWHDQDLARRFAYDMVDFLYGIDRGSPHDLFINWQCFQDRVPKDTIPIGNDPGPNMILLGVSGARRGHVLFWVSGEEVQEGEEPDDRNVGFVAPSFTAFLDSLTDECTARA